MIRKTAGGAILLASALLFLASACAQEVPAPIALRTKDGREIQLLRIKGSGSGGDASVGGGGRTSVLYRLSEEVPAEGPRDALEIRYVLSGIARLDLYGKAAREDPFLSVELPGGPGEISWILPMPGTAGIGALRFTVPPPGKEDGEAGRLVLLSLEVRESEYIFEAREGGARFSRGASLARSDGGRKESLQVEHPFPADGRAFLEIKAREGTVRVFSAGGRSAYVRFPRPGTAFLPLSALGGAGAMTAESDTAGLVTGLAVRPGNGEIVPVDLAIILAHPAPPQDALYTLFRWSVLPETLIFDFRDYSVQDAYLKRLAFFVEKEGFRGRLAADSEIRSLHGWNAHDYRAEDLASFFDKARRTGFPLSAQERELEGLLEREGILVREEGRIHPGRGAVLSISRESSSYFRRLFLNHEAAHAVFFLDGDYRSLAKSLWKSLNERERRFWNVFLSNRDYDPGDEYLSYNELQAYLVQQPVSRLEDWMREIAYARLARSYPGRAAEIEADMNAALPGFLRRAEALDDYLRETYGVKAGAMELVRFE